MPVWDTPTSALVQEPTSPGPYNSGMGVSNVCMLVRARIVCMLVRARLMLPRPPDRWEAHPASTFYVPMTKLFAAHIATTMVLAPSSFCSLERLDNSGAGVPLFAKADLALLMLHVNRSIAAGTPSVPMWNQSPLDEAGGQTLPELNDLQMKHGIFREDNILRIEFNPDYWALLLGTNQLVQRSFRAAPHWLLQANLPLGNQHIRCCQASARLSAKLSSTDTIYDIRIRFQRDSRRDLITKLKAANVRISENLAQLKSQHEENEMKILAATLQNDELSRTMYQRQHDDTQLELPL